MGIVTIPRVPPGRVLRLGSGPLARGVVSALPLNGVSLDIVSGNRLTLGTAGYFSGRDNRSIGLRGNGSAACASVPIDLSALTKATVSFWLWWDAYANDDDLAMEFTSNFSTANGFLVDPNSGTPAAGEFQFGVGSSGALYNSAKFARPSAATWHYYSLCMDRTTGAAQGNSCFVDGVAQTVTAAGTLFDVADNFANSTLYLFSRNNASLFGAGVLRDLTIHNRLLTEAEHRALWKDTAGELYQIDSGRRYFVPSAAGSGVGSASGTGDATGVGASLFSAAGSAAGTGTATATGASTSAAAGSASGTGTATGTGASLFAGVGSASGTGTATGVGDSIAAGSAVGSASGTGTATGIGAALYAGVGSATGESIVLGAGSFIGTVSAVGSASGTSTAAGVGAHEGGDIWTVQAAASGVWTTQPAASGTWTLQ